MRWLPDTCPCVFDLNPEHWETGAGVVAVSLCPSHAGLAPTAAFQAVHKGENRVKNQALAAVVAVAGVEPDEVGWRFGPDRALIVTLPARAKGRKTEIQRAADATTSPGRPITFE